MFKKLGAAGAAITLAFAGSASAATLLQTKVIETHTYADFWYNGPNRVGEELKFASASATSIWLARFIANDVGNLHLTNLVLRGRPGLLVTTDNYPHSKLLGVIGDDGFFRASDVLVTPGYFAIRTGRYGFDILSVEGYGIGVAAVPEPSTWALLIAGFGGVGCALRRRQRERLSEGVENVRL